MLNNMGSNYLLYSGGFFFSSVKKKKKIIIKIYKSVEIFFFGGVGVLLRGGGGVVGFALPPFGLCVGRKHLMAVLEALLTISVCQPSLPSGSL